eukprot:1144701-Pelagomonas_calceolata.AAC.2
MPRWAGRLCIVEGERKVVKRRENAPQLRGKGVEMGASGAGKGGWGCWCAAEAETLLHGAEHLMCMVSRMV